MTAPCTFAKDLSFVFSKSISTARLIARYAISKTCHLVQRFRPSPCSVEVEREFQGKRETQGMDAVEELVGPNGEAFRTLRSSCVFVRTLSGHERRESPLLALS